MKLTIQRFCKHRKPISSIKVEYEVPQDAKTLLDALTYIKTKIDATLTFNSGCKSGVCGSCAVRVNEKEKLACSYKPKDKDIIEPLSKTEIIKDLVVDHQKPQKTLKRVKSWLDEPSKIEKMRIEDEKRIEKQTDCILCSSCYSSCPVLEVDEEFLGPFALTRIYRYTSDIRFDNEKSRIDIIQKKGIWDCTLCGECTTACPQGIDPKNDIIMLRNKSAKYGYTDPNFANDNNMFNSGFDPGF